MISTAAADDELCRRALAAKPEHVMVHRMSVLELYRQCAPLRRIQTTAALAMLLASCCTLFETNSETNGADPSSNVAWPDLAVCNAVAEKPATWLELEEEVVVRINAERANGANCGSEGDFPPAGPLSMRADLRCAARAHSQDMVDRDFFDHVDPDGKSPTDRLDEVGFQGSTWGENIAAGNATAADTVAQWMKSDGHCANLMRADYTVTGLGYAEGGRYRYLWTQTFGG